MTSGELTSDRLGELVDKTDELGGPNSLDAHSFWQGLSYSSKQFIDETLDPF